MQIGGEHLRVNENTNTTIAINSIKGEEWFELQMNDSAIQNTRNTATPLLRDTLTRLQVAHPLYLMRKRPNCFGSMGLTMYAASHTVRKLQSNVSFMVLNTNALHIHFTSNQVGKWRYPIMLIGLCDRNLLISHYY